MFGFRNEMDSETMGIDYHNAGEYERAATCFMRGAQNGSELSISFLAYYYERGLGVPQDMNRAFDLYSRIWEYNSEASYKLGFFYENGLGTYRDEEKAVDYYIRAYREASYGDEDECRPPYNALVRLSGKYPRARQAVLVKKF